MNAYKKHITTTLCTNNFLNSVFRNREKLRKISQHSVIFRTGSRRFSTLPSPPLPPNHPLPQYLQSFQDFSRTKLNFQGLPTRNVISQMVYKCTFPVQANRFLRLQVFASSSFLHFSVHLSFLFISCFYTRVLKLLYTGKECQSLSKAICFRSHYIQS